MAKPVLIKKYGNRRLYDTDESKYLTLDELAAKIQGGTDVSVVEVKTGEDLTQITLTQIVIESRGAARLLPVPLLTQMIRMGDDALAEFLGQYVTSTMELYLRTVRGMQQLSPFAGLAMPNPVRDTLARFFGVPFQWGGGTPATPYVNPSEKPPPTPEQLATNDELAALRKEIEELKETVGHQTRKRRAKSKS